MDHDRQEIRLKSGLHRAVRLRVDADGGRSVAKIFRSRNWWRRAADGRRARHEYRLQCEFYGAGLAIPRPFAVDRAGGPWELRSECIAGARSLLEITRPDAPSHTAPGRLARRLGALLGQAHALGLDHGDLHPGNLLLDDSDKLWLIDFSAARRRSPLPLEVIERDLTGLWGDLRETFPAPLETRFWVAWQRAFRAHGGELGESVQHAAERARDLAAGRRRDVLLEHQDRWTRDSGLCERRRIGSVRVLVARHASARAWAERIDWEAILGQREERSNACLDQQDLHVDASAEAERKWITLGRAWQHRLPVATPLFLVPGRRARAGYALPANSNALPTGAAATPQLAALLRDRELALQASHLWRAPSGEVLLGPGSRLMPTREPHRG